MLLVDLDLLFLEMKFKGYFLIGVFFLGLGFFFSYYNI